MDDRGNLGFAAEIAAALGWWRAAGVDVDYADETVRWLKPEEQPESPAAEAVVRQQRALESTPSRPAIDRFSWPQDLGAFADWWLTEPALDEGRVSGRVPPRGNAGAELMVIVPDPERDDAERLLSGAQGQLLDAMLGAMGIAADAVYVASVLPRHMPMADWPALTENGFGALLCHHVRLVAPRRLVAFGGNILPLLGNDPAHSPAVLREFNHEGLTIPLLAGMSLAALLERPRWKAGLWQGWLDWTGGQAGRV